MFYLHFPFFVISRGLLNPSCVLYCCCGGCNCISLFFYILFFLAKPLSLFQEWTSISPQWLIEIFFIRAALNSLPVNFNSFFKKFWHFSLLYLVPCHLRVSLFFICYIILDSILYISDIMLWILWSCLNHIENDNIFSLITKLTWLASDCKFQPDH